METPETTESLDLSEQRLVEKLGYCIRNGYWSEVDKYSRTLVNIATYRRVKAGLKSQLTPPEKD